MDDFNLIQHEDIYSEIKKTLLLSRHQAYSAVNFTMVQAYWQIVRIIVEHEQDGNARAGYGEYVLQELSTCLTKDFGKGFSVRTLQQMKKFYVMFPNTIALRSQLTWTHYRLPPSVENEQARSGTWAGLSPQHGRSANWSGRFQRCIMSAIIYPLCVS